MRLEKGFEMSNVLLFLSSMKPDSMESVYYHSGKLTDADERNQVYRLLCANEKLVENNHAILVSPLETPFTRKLFFYLTIIECGSMQSDLHHPIRTFVRNV